MRQGVKPVRAGRPGDLLCRIVVENPGQPDPGEQKELLEKFAATMEASGERHTPQQGSWLDGVKKFFGGYEILKTALCAESPNRLLSIASWVGDIVADRMGDM